MEAFAQCRRHHYITPEFELFRYDAHGWPFVRDHEEYVVTADRRLLLDWGLCNESQFPEGRKRTAYFRGGSLKKERTRFRLRLHSVKGTLKARCEALFQQAKEHNAATPRLRLVVDNGALGRAR